MVKKKFNVQLDIKRSSSNREFEVVDGDNANELIVTLTDNGAPVNLTDCTVLAVFSKSDGNTAQQDKEHGISVGGENTNVITIDLFTTSFTPGMVECEIKVISASNRLVTSAKFNFYCRKSMLSNKTIISSNEYPLLINLIEGAQAAQLGLDAIASDEAERQSNEAIRVSVESARASAENLRETAEAARQMQSAKWGNPTAVATALPAGANPSAEVSVGETNVAFTFGIPGAAEGGGETGVAFTESELRSNINSGETLDVLFGKIKKWFTDLKALAFKESIANSDITDSAVTNAKLADMPNATIKGNVSGSASGPSDLTAANVRTLLNITDGADATLPALYAGSDTATILDAEYVPISVSPSSTKKITWANIKSALNGLYAALGHNHSGVYSDSAHDHATVYSQINHDHDGTYSPAAHNHNTSYSALTHYHNSDYSSLSHAHGNLSSDGKIGSTAELPVFTAAGGMISTKTVADAQAALGVAPAVIALKTLTAAGWSGGAQSVTDAAVTAGSPGDIKISHSATAAQFLAWAQALPQVTAQADGSITITARGTVPNLDIPVVLEVRK